MGSTGIDIADKNPALRRVRTAARLVVQGDFRTFWRRIRESLGLPEREPDIAAIRPGAGNYRQEAWPSDRPLVSVVIPCFNYGQFVAEAVRSVLDQTFGDIEIIVVDGGSTSAESVAALRGLSAPKTRVYFREDGRHLVGDNRNFGIARAAGRYICCLDADDRLASTYLEKAVFLLENYGYDVVSTSIQCFGASADIFHVLKTPTLAEMMEGNHVTTCAVFRRELWERAGGFRDYGLGADYVAEDWCLWMRMAALGARIHNIVEEPLFLYRQHAAVSLSTHPDSKSFPDQGRLIRESSGDLLTPAAITRSRERAALTLRAANGLVNLRAANDPRQTILVAVPASAQGEAVRLVGEVAARLASQGYRMVFVTTRPATPPTRDVADCFAGVTAEIYNLPQFLDLERWYDFVFYLLAVKEVSLLWIVGSTFFYDLLPDMRAQRPGLKVADLPLERARRHRRYAPYIDLDLAEDEEVSRFLAESGASPQPVAETPGGVGLATRTPPSVAAKMQAAIERLIGAPERRDFRP